MSESTQFVADVCNDMKLDAETERRLKDILYLNLANYELSVKKHELTVQLDETSRIIQLYLTVRRLEGRANATLLRYSRELRTFFTMLNKSIKEITANDIRAYLSYFKEKRNNLAITINGKLCCLKAFFSWCHSEGYTVINPSSNVNLSKTSKVIKQGFTDSDVEKLMNGAKCARDRAIIQTLLSTGCRVSELVSINRSDIDWDNRKVLICGKGDKQRYVYLNEKCIFYLRQYLKERTDDNPCLFISQRHGRLGIRGTETVLKTLGIKVGVSKVHPHRCRRTLATNLLNKGMGLASVREILGHESMDTTLKYAQISKGNVQSDFNKFG